MCHTIIVALLKIFGIRFGLGSNKKRRYILYFAVSLITENINYEIKVFDSKEKIENVMKQIDLIYKQVKKNEVKPDTDYLFNNSVNKNLEKTVQKLDKMNSLIGFIPRNK